MPEVIAALFSSLRRNAMRSSSVVLSSGALMLVPAAAAADAKAAAAATNYHKNVAPILEKYCYDCHGNGLNKGKVSFDSFTSDDEMLA
ncbi:MAG: hypothetical protein V4773_24010, partial [Verrucomicrobiota bacterium]